MIVEKERKKVGSFLYTFFFPDKEVREKGDDLGVFIYITTWFFVILAFVISQDTKIIGVNSFYLFFDVICIIYMILYFMTKRMQEKKELFEFPDGYSLIFMIFYTIILYCIISIINVTVSPLIQTIYFEGDILKEIFMLIRVVPVEELVFRGMGFFIVIFILSKIFNTEDNPKRETIIWYFTIVLIGIMFGLYHFPKFYKAETFPYFLLNAQGTIIEVHIAYPILYLSLLGFVLGLCRKKYGLVSAMLLHLINNLVANAIIYAIL